MTSYIIWCSSAVIIAFHTYIITCLSTISCERSKQCQNHMNIAGGLGSCQGTLSCGIMDRAGVLNMDGTHTTVGPNKHQRVIYHDTPIMVTALMMINMRVKILFCRFLVYYFIWCYWWFLYEAVSVVLNGAHFDYGTYKVIPDMLILADLACCW